MTLPLRPPGKLKRRVFQLDPWAPESLRRRKSARPTAHQVPIHQRFESDLSGREHLKLLPIRALRVRAAEFWLKLGKTDEALKELGCTSLILGSKPVRLAHMDTLNYGDNLDILPRHLEDETVHLVYLDPPFNSARNYNALFHDKNGTEAANRIQAFEDIRRKKLRRADAVG
jgi:hypothetical protein